MLFNPLLILVRRKQLAYISNSYCTPKTFRGGGNEEFYFNILFWIQDAHMKLDSTAWTFTSYLSTKCSHKVFFCSTSALGNYNHCYKHNAVILSLLSSWNSLLSQNTFKSKLQLKQWKCCLWYHSVACDIILLPIPVPHFLYQNAIAYKMIGPPTFKP